MLFPTPNRQRGNDDGDGAVSCSHHLLRAAASTDSDTDDGSRRRFDGGVDRVSCSHYLLIAGESTYDGGTVCSVDTVSCSRMLDKRQQPRRLTNKQAAPPPPPFNNYRMVPAEQESTDSNVDRQTMRL